MKYVQVSPIGIIQSTMTCSEAPPPELGWIAVDDHVSQFTHWCRDGVLTPYATDNYRNPLTHQCEWDPMAEVWVDARPFATQQAAKLAAVEAERDARIRAPIAYNRRMVDADQRAQQNITDKISELTAREATGTAMPLEAMVWRDADNQTATFETEAEMKMWLQGLVIAITQRGTEAYTWSWQVKELVNTATTSEELAGITW